MTTTKWTNRVAFDIALALEGSGETVDEIRDRYGITTADILSYNSDPVFLRQVDDYRADIRDNGVTFRMKARAQAEELLTTSWGLIHDTNVSAAVKADLIKSTVKWAGLEARNDDDNGLAAGGVKININFGDEAKTMTVTSREGDEAKTIEHSP